MKALIAFFLGMLSLQAFAQPACIPAPQQMNQPQRCWDGRIIIGWNVGVPVVIGQPVVMGGFGSPKNNTQLSFSWNGSSSGNSSGNRTTEAAPTRREAVPGDPAYCPIRKDGLIVKYVSNPSRDASYCTTVFNSLVAGRSNLSEYPGKTPDEYRDSRR